MEAKNGQHVVDSDLILSSKNKNPNQWLHTECIKKFLLKWVL